ncbi:uncharacterized protein A1O9_12331 [Exophiala aquamarina CBS 119918]|uniref:Sas10 C-terminal domain-containing protein n=1 Tax=Exophiala aquamarina CBS 119918 TaxID=1182545 RepID=A0A072NVS4_9EURO|nr:uncharacterized protein A1O9_12331 [Exophiala aquamarina CBS 119918]KEF51696.1 hypothetical protein A1O9_12331 [Exophiala aquamarina CBS 119918]
MAKKRKAGRATGNPVVTRNDDLEDHFNDSEDEFFAGRDKILLDEEPTAKRRRRLQEQEIDLQSSDEEVFQNLDPLSNDDDDESDEDLDLDPRDVEDAAPVEEEDEDETADRFWGASRGDYYNTDVIETEADALEEEAEARRLQQKQLKSMTDADFGFDESAWIDVATQASNSRRRPAVEKLPEVQVPENASKEERLQMLKSRYPEFEPLTSDFLELQNTYTSLKEKVQTIGNSIPTVTLTKFLALSAYMGSVAMYLAVLTSPQSGIALNPVELHDHPVMAAILRSRQLWLDAQDLKEKAVQHQIEQKQGQESLTLPIAIQPKSTTKDNKVKVKGASPSPSSNPVNCTTTIQKPKKPSKVKRNDLQTLLAASLHKSTAEEEPNFGDEAPLTKAEAEEKARKKKSLRFYTSQIAQKSNKRGVASRHAGGDDDIPHKERFRDRQDRLMREAEQRGQSGTNDLEVVDTDDEDLVGVRQNHAESNKYYDSLVANSKQKRLDKQNKADAYAEASKSGGQVYEEEQIDIDGKRKITYAIEKNKGLAPKRKKDVRNPRVKKRKKYDEKMKKLSSIRQVYKGGEGRGGYGGEATGIKTNLVKSTKL